MREKRVIFGKKEKREKDNGKMSKKGLTPYL